MAPVTTVFHQFVSDLELTDREAEEASRQQNVVRANLRARLASPHDFLSGSYARRTAIRPLHDIDLIFVLDSGVHGPLLQGPPNACLSLVHEALQDAYCANRENFPPTKIQRRSVNIEFSGTGIGFDVVPAFADSQSYWIPDREVEQWIRTAPERHRQACIEANERAGGMLNTLIKAAKCWNREQGKPLRSFHLEVMAYSIFYTKPDSYPEGLRDLFRGLAHAIQYRCREPAGLGPDLDHEFSDSQRAALRARLEAAAEEMDRALRAAEDGRTEEAHYYWRSLLGDTYPEKGRAPTIGPSTSSQHHSAVDAPDRRFG
jgi:hypothetical protein